jgi:hypothetical protein
VRTKSSQTAKYGPTRGSFFPKEFDHRLSEQAVGAVDPIVFTQVLQLSTTTGATISAEQAQDERDHDDRAQALAGEQRRERAGPVPKPV